MILSKDYLCQIADTYVLKEMRKLGMADEFDLLVWAPNEMLDDSLKPNPYAGPFSFTTLCGREIIVLQNNKVTEPEMFVIRYPCVSWYSILKIKLPDSARAS